MPSRVSSRAFTLIEMLIAIGIIAILAGLLLPALKMALFAARRTACMSNLRQIGIGFHSYIQDYGDVFPAAEDPVHTNPAYWLWMGRGWRPALAPYLVMEERAFWCPMDTAAVKKFSSTSYAYSMAFYHSPDQINTLTTSADTWSNPLPPIPQYLGRVRTAERKILAGEWTSNHRPAPADNGWWNWQGSRNMLFVDGHVEYRDAASLRPANDTWPDPNLTHDGIRGQDID